MVRKVTQKKKETLQQARLRSQNVDNNKNPRGKILKKWMLNKIISARVNQYENYPGYQDEMQRLKNMDDQEKDEKKNNQTNKKLNKNKNKNSAKKSVKQLQKSEKTASEKQKLTQISKLNKINLVDKVKKSPQKQKVQQRNSIEQKNKNAQEFSASKTRQGTKFHDSQKNTEKNEEKTAQKGKKQNKKSKICNQKTAKKKETSEYQDSQEKQELLQNQNENQKQNQKQNTTKKIKKIKEESQIQNSKSQKSKKVYQARAKELNDFIQQGKFQTWQKQQIKNNANKNLLTDELDSEEFQDDESESMINYNKESDSGQLISFKSEICDNEGDKEEKEYKQQQQKDVTLLQLEELQKIIQEKKQQIELLDQQCNQSELQIHSKSLKSSLIADKQLTKQQDELQKPVRRSPRINKETNSPQIVQKNCQKKLFIKKCIEEEKEEIENGKFNQKNEQNIDKIDTLNTILEKCEKIQKNSRKSSKADDLINQYLSEKEKSILTFKTPLKKLNSNLILNKQNSAYSITSLDSAQNFNAKKVEYNKFKVNDQNFIQNNSNTINEFESQNNFKNYKKFNREAVKQNFIIDSEQNLDIDNNISEHQNSQLISESKDSSVQELKYCSNLQNLSKMKQIDKWTTNYFAKNNPYSPITTKQIQEGQQNLEVEKKTLIKQKSPKKVLKKQKITLQSDSEQSDFSEKNDLSYENFEEEEKTNLNKTSKINEFLENSQNNINEEFVNKQYRNHKLIKIDDFQNQLENQNVLQKCKQIQQQIDNLHSHALEMKEIKKKQQNSSFFNLKNSKIFNQNGEFQNSNLFKNNKNFGNFVQNVDIAFCVDATSGMEDYVNKMQDIILTLFQKCLKKNVDLKIAIVFYRDHPPEEESFVTQVMDSTNNISDLMKFIKSIGEASGGGDIPEAVLDGLYDSLKKVNWRSSAIKYIVHIGDAPPHGDIYTGQGSIFNRSFMWRDGCPCGLTIEKVSKLINNYKFRYRLVKIGDNQQLMSKIFKQNINDFKEIKINNAKKLDKYIAGMVISESVFVEDIE